MDITSRGVEVSVYMHTTTSTATDDKKKGAATGGRALYSLVPDNRYAFVASEAYAAMADWVKAWYGTRYAMFNGCGATRFEDAISR